MLMQSVWKEEGKNWDDNLDESYAQAWEMLEADNVLLHTFKLPRAIANVNQEIFLVVFADASKVAFGVALYVVIPGVASNLLVSKGKLCPVKEKRSIPQLELTALQMAVIFAQHVILKLDSLIICKTFVFSDSELVLQQVRNQSKTSAYVLNRVETIRNHSQGMIFGHVRTNENPADLISRGVSVKDLRAKFYDLWFHGPEWLKTNEWPPQKPNIKDQIHTQICEIYTDIVAPTKPEEWAENSLFDLKKFSSLKRALKITKGILSFAYKLLKKDVSQINYEALYYWIRVEQFTIYPIVVALLKGRMQSSKNSYKIQSKFIQDLGLEISSENLIVCRTRIQDANLEETAKKPILLPPRAYITELIIKQMHEENLHAGVNMLLSQVRQKFWIPKGRQSIKNVVNKCNHCRRYRAKPFVYPGPPKLPIQRVQHVAPFKQVGIDYTGHIFLKDSTNGNKESKVYIALFTCLTSRAVHLEVAIDMSPGFFLLLFRRFVARYGLPQFVLSDNGSNLVPVANFFEKIQSSIEVREYMEENCIQWNRIPPKSPWQGGVYERIIGLTKNSLAKVLHHKVVNFHELLTIVKEVESTINARPLTYINDEIRGKEILTPQHLLTGRALVKYPNVVNEMITDPEFANQDGLSKQFSRITAVIEEFRKDWERSYLTSLKEKHYGQGKVTQDRKPRVGEIVLVKADRPRDQWNLAKIIKVKPDPDDIVRSVMVKVGKQELLKTIEKLYPLEICENAERKKISGELRGLPADFEGFTHSCRPRKAAKLARDVIQSQTQREDDDFSLEDLNLFISGN